MAVYILVVGVGRLLCAGDRAEIMEGLEASLFSNKGALEAISKEPKMNCYGEKVLLPLLLKSMESIGFPCHREVVTGDAKEFGRRLVCGKTAFVNLPCFEEKTEFPYPSETPKGSRYISRVSVTWYPSTPIRDEAKLSRLADAMEKRLVDDIQKMYDLSCHSNPNRKEGELAALLTELLCESKDPKAPTKKWGFWVSSELQEENHNLPMMMVNIIPNRSFFADYPRPKKAKRDTK